MKFTDVRTLNSVLKEYGLQSGAPTPVGQQVTGAVAKATAAPTKAPKKDLGSPTVTPGLDLPDIGDPETDTVAPTLMKAKDFDDGAEYLDDKGEVAGKVVSKVGKGPALKKLVVQDPKGEYTLIDPDEELTVAPITESKGGKYSKKVHKNALRKTSKSKNSVSSVKQKIKKLARKVQMQEQGEEQLFELNFNTKEIIESALDSPIKCGFEAETVWGGYVDSDANYGEDIDDMSWSDIEDRIMDEFGRSYLDDINEAYRNWIMEDKMYEYEGDLISELVTERKEDPEYIENFVDSQGGPTEYAVERYKEDFRSNNPEEYESRIEDGYEYMNWVREIVEEEMEDEFIEWLEQDIRDNGEVFDAAMEAAEEDLSISDWVSDTYGSMSSMLGEFEIWLADNNEAGLEGIGEELRSWAYDNSQSTQFEVGEYHSGGINNDYWRLEDDSSIEGDGAGAEIISPVYNTPRVMLEEIKSLFELLADRDVETNRSTGLHVTMSLDPTRQDMPANSDVNKVKLAVLLGDKYIASTFGRENNSYSKSQYERLERKAAELKANPNSTKTIQAIEEILEGAISSDKFSSINFKNQADNQSGYNLIEFRIAGGHDYHEDIQKIVKATVRYAETLRAAYTDDHQQDYVKALFKLINNVGKISNDLEDRVKGRYEDLDHPVVDVLKGFFGKDHYMESVGTLARAFKHLFDYRENMATDADAKWEQRVAQWEEQTGDKHERLKEAPTPREAAIEIMKPQKRPPSVQAPKYLKEAQNMFSAAVAQAGYDLNQNMNRTPVNAKAIGVLRKTISEFELTYETLSEFVNRNYKQIEFARGSADQETEFSRVKNGVDRLFKKDIIESPEWLSPLQVEKIVTGVWNAINSEDQSHLTDKELARAIINASGNTHEDDVERIFNDVTKSNSTTYENLYRLIAGGRGDWFSAGNPIQAKDYDTLLKRLKSYPAWDKPVARSYDARNVSNDSYANTSMRSMFGKLDRRMDALGNLNSTNPELYINSLKQVFNSTKQLLKAVVEEGGFSGEPSRDAPNFVMPPRNHDRIVEIMKDLEATNYTASPFDDNAIPQVYGHVRSWLADAFDTFNRSERTPEQMEEMKPRTDAISKWLSGLDVIAQKLGFSSQSGAIDSKLNQVQKGKEFQIANHGEWPATITAFNYGGQVYVLNEIMEMINFTQNTPGMDEPVPEFYGQFNFNSSMFRSSTNGVLVIPNAHYFIALEAYEMFTNKDYFSKAGWRQTRIRAILDKFTKVYGIRFETLDSAYKKINLRLLKEMGVQVIEKGDGREGLAPYNFAPLLPREEINAPNGEPFEPASAASWALANPDRNNAGVERTRGVTELPMDGLDDGPTAPFRIARAAYPVFDKMMRDGMQRYLPAGAPVNELVAFLNNPERQLSIKEAVLLVIFQGGATRGSNANQPPILTFQNAYSRGTEALRNGEVPYEQGPLASSSANHIPHDESVFDKFDKLPLEEQLNLLDKVNDSKLNKVFETLAANTTSLSPVTEGEERSDIQALMKDKCDEWLNSVHPGQYSGYDDLASAMFEYARELSHDDLNSPYELRNFMHNPGEEASQVVQDVLARTDMSHYFPIHEIFGGGGVPDYKTMPTYKLKRATKGKHKFFVPSNEPTPKGVAALEDVTDTLTLPKIKVGDEVKVGKFKNRKAEVTGFDKDENNHPLLKTTKGNQQVFKPRISKLMKEGVPNLNKIRILNKILADHFPVSDLKKQMLAYEAIPIPQMLTDFRGLRAGSGDDACARGVVRHYIQALTTEEQKQINLQEWSKSKVRALVESKGIMGRVTGDTFLKGDDKLEFQQVDLYPLEEMQFENAELRDAYIQQLEQENNIQVEWTNNPNNGSLAFGLAMLTDPMLDDKITYWGRYFKQKTADMMGKWGNSQVPIGWKLQTAGAMKLDIGIDPQHLIATPAPFNGVTDVIQAVKTNSAGNELSESLVNALETIHTQVHPVFPGQIANLPALRDYFGEIMGPVALMSEMVGGQADAAKADLLSGQPWASCNISWPMAMNAPLVDSEFTAPDGTIVGISSKGGKGAKASVKNIHDAIADAPDVMKAQYQTTVKIVNIVSKETAKDGPFRLAQLYRILPQGLEQEINGYIQAGKQDYAGLSPACTELFNYGTPRQDVPGFNTGYAMLALLAKKVTRTINSAGPEFGQGCVAFLNQSSIVQLYCKMGKNGQDARVTGRDAVYPPNFQGTVEIDGSKNYYSSRIGGKFAFGFK